MVGKEVGTRAWVGTQELRKIMAHEGGASGSSRYSAIRLMKTLHEAHPGQVQKIKGQWRARVEVVTAHFRRRALRREAGERRIAELEDRVADLEDRLEKLASALQRSR